MALVGARPEGASVERISDAFEPDEELAVADVADGGWGVRCAPDPAAIAHEKRVRAEQQSQFKALKRSSQAIYGEVSGRPGARTPQQWAEVLEKAGDDVGNGRFIVRQLGAERYLDLETVAVLVTLRQNLISDLPRVTAAEIMKVDLAVIAYYNVLRVQGWIGNLSLVVERELFGEEPLNSFHESEIGERLEEQIRRFAEILLPVQDRASRMMMRALAALPQAGATRPAKGPRSRRKLVQTSSDTTN